jgi:WD40 repeat protein
MKEGKLLKNLKAPDCFVKNKIIAFDWSEDSNTILVNTYEGEVLYVSAKTGAQIDPSEGRGKLFSTFTSPFNWVTKGAYSQTTLDSQIVCCSSRQKNVVVLGDCYAGLKMFKFPFASQKQQCKEYSAHITKICAVDFTYNDKYLVTCGEKEGNILLWETDFETKDSNKLN